MCLMVYIAAHGALRKVDWVEAAPPSTSPICRQMNDVWTASFQPGMWCTRAAGADFSTASIRRTVTSLANEAAPRLTRRFRQVPSSGTVSCRHD